MNSSDLAGDVADTGTFRLECGACGADNGLERLATLCPECGGPQLVRYAESADKGIERTGRAACGDSARSCHCGQASIP